MASLWRTTLMDAAIDPKWVAKVGQRPSTRRIGLVFQEPMLRMQAAGLAQDRSHHLGSRSNP
jgi:hypothetical protein